jgi:hypothetical protein
MNEQIKQGEILEQQSYIPPTAPFKGDTTYALLKSASIAGNRTATRVEPLSIPIAPILKYVLPGYLKPLPGQMTSADVDYLFAKGALSLLHIPVRNALF